MLKLDGADLSVNRGASERPYMIYITGLSIITFLIPIRLDLPAPSPTMITRQHQSPRGRCLLSLVTAGQSPQVLVARTSDSQSVSFYLHFSSPRLQEETVQLISPSETANTQLPTCMYFALNEPKFLLSADTNHIRWYPDGDGEYYATADTELM